MKWPHHHGGQKERGRMPVHLTEEGFLLPTSEEEAKPEDAALVRSFEEWEQRAGLLAIETAGCDLERSAGRWSGAAIAGWSFATEYVAGEAASALRTLPTNVSIPEQQLAPRESRVFLNFVGRFPFCRFFPTKLNWRPFLALFPGRYPPKTSFNLLKTAFLPSKSPIHSDKTRFGPLFSHVLESRHPPLRIPSPTTSR
jgi:hypothetical protein